jgi:hypothetical protein
MIDQMQETVELGPDPNLDWAVRPRNAAERRYLSTVDQSRIRFDGATIAGHQKGFADLATHKSFEDLTHLDWWQGVKEIGTASEDLRKALRTDDESSFRETTNDLFLGSYQAAIEHYAKHGIYPPKPEELTPEYFLENGQMFHVLEIDADIIEELFNDYTQKDDELYRELCEEIGTEGQDEREGIKEALKIQRIQEREMRRREFSISLNQMLEHASKSGIEVSIYINQFANPDQIEQEVHPQERFERVKEQLKTLTGPTFIEEGTLNIEPLPATTLQDWKDSIDEIRANGQNMLRFDAVWSKLIDDSGNFDQDELEKLKEIMRYAKDHDGKNKVDIMLCLSHFTLPKRYEDHWATEGVVDDFVNYAERLLNHLEHFDLLPESILTFNEPLNSLAAGFLHGGFPPFRRFNDDPQNLLDMFKAFDNTVDAHIKVYEMIKSKEHLKHLNVGFSNNLPVYSPYHDIFPLDHPISYLVADFTEIWLDRLLSKSSDKFQFDFIGLQYYSKFHVGLFGSNLGMNHKRMVAPERLNPLPNGWTRFPEGLSIQALKLNTLILEKAKRNKIKKLPSIRITEMGIPTQVDPEKEMKIINASVKFARDLSVLDIEAALKWNPGEDFDEIGVGKRTDSGFGNKKRKGKNGDKKPLSKKLPDALNVAHPEIHFWVKRLNDVIEDYMEFREVQHLHGEIDKETFLSDRAVVEAKQKRTREYLDAYQLRGFEGAFGTLAENTDAFFNRRSFTLQFASSAIDVMNKPEKYRLRSTALKTLVTLVGKYLEKP